MTEPVRLGRSLSGPAGTALEVIPVTPLVPEHAATVAAWFLTCPRQSPLWERYVLSVVHLRPMPGVPAPQLVFEGATHELDLLALDPDPDPQANRPETWRFLMPVNYSGQLRLPSDDAARDLLVRAAQAVVDGQLWAEPPLSGQQEPWCSWLAGAASIDTPAAPADEP